MKTLIYNADIVSCQGVTRGYVVIDGQLIDAVGEGEVPGQLAAQCGLQIDFEGDMLMAGVIDTHVHFRDPGLTAKGDIESESRAAVAGGVTSYLDMPNTKPQTVTFDALAEKMARAAEVSWGNYGFFIGATNSNVAELTAGDYSRCPGVKVFLGASTGNMCMDDDTMLTELATRLPEGVPMAFHAEDNAVIAANAAAVSAAVNPVPVDFHPLIRSREACVNAARRVVKLARQTGRRCVLMHLSTADELSLAARVDNLFLETCPQYLMFDVTDYSLRGSRIKCNPAIKSVGDREALLQALAREITHISTDHAPHLPEDKEGDALHAASGMPGVQFSLCLMLSLADAPTVTGLMSEMPARIYDIEDRGAIKPGMYADLVRVTRADDVIDDEVVISRCGWTPYAGIEVKHKVLTTWVNGEAVYDKGNFDPTKRSPRALSFRH